MKYVRIDYVRKSDKKGIETTSYIASARKRRHNDITSLLREMYQRGYEIIEIIDILYDDCNETLKNKITVRQLLDHVELHSLANSSEYVSKYIKQQDKQKQLLDLYREYATNTMNDYWQKQLDLVNKGRENRDILHDILNQETGL